MRIAAIKDNEVIFVHVYNDMEEAKEFWDKGAFVGADSIEPIPDEFDVGDTYANGKWAKKETMMNTDIDTQEEEPLPQEVPMSEVRSFSSADILLAESQGIELEITPEILMKTLSGAPVKEMGVGEEWRAGIKATKGQEIQYKNSRFLILEDHITKEGYEPNKTHTLYEKLKNK